MQLFFNEALTTDHKEITFSKEESKHIVKVLRKKEGDFLNITNGQGYLFKAKINLASTNKCIAQIIEIELQEKPKIHIHLAVAPTKMNDRYEWFLEKATEIGIQEITPIICDHSERKVIKIERYKKIIQSATKQSLRYHMPKINDALPFNDFIKNHENETLYIAHCEETKRQSLKTTLAKTNSNHFTILIGPKNK